MKISLETVPFQSETGKEMKISLETEPFYAETGKEA
ncbi:hypothetical protein J2S17_000110 [Cytobacillus purgationiresistens]|uniref:Uncharacterized protein n=1 Tax=Cytobacillus purgationiresistens TaxID=863449 RepID=A0ABU0AAH2_9BACI|nr:hypothetical protein [Cytobacillus purgationiresistens]